MYVQGMLWQTPTQTKISTNKDVQGKMCWWKSLGPIGMTTCTLEFPNKFQQQIIVYKNLLWPVILRLDFSHNYLIGIDWFSSNQ